MAKGAVEKDHTKINDEIAVDTSEGPPKSKKQLRLERKAAKKRITEQTDTPEKNDEKIDGGGEYLDKKEYRRRKKLQKEEIRKEQEKIMRKELQEEKKIRKRKKLNREMNSKGAAKKKQKLAMEQPNSSATIEENSSKGIENKKSSKKKKRDQSKEEQDASMDAFRSVLYGTTGASSKVGGMTTTRLGVQYKDKVIGKGKLLRDGKPITVKYELTGGKFGAVLDSSNKFTFRPGMGEVIQGWDIGLEGMREGGRRKLIIPPKAGYGGKDIGAGPGALLYFDVTLLSCGKS